MAIITGVDTFLGRGPITWQEYRWGEQQRIQCEFLDDATGADVPVDLSGLTLQVRAETLMVDAAEVAPTRSNPIGSVTLSNPQALDPVQVDDVDIRMEDAAAGRFSILTPDPHTPNPAFGATRVPALILWFRYELAQNPQDKEPQDVGAMGIFYRRGYGGVAPA